ncbi:bifunctional 4-hydroxy-2-oxoglutarate aldolase/2-dehydro-3-deoxy-phosphogluconate aldolase [Anthocerotibacter panamensis]|uniref:bifunctional 4-hydroxy-2-oxoglutarate aldolase/2-dehydro-3-deoxy-phosphogluconate aldolase n=1 Tax=Anthocerotibacter panamensis TaxID=2857077 RepID=UPI001C404936|nr:bifunctional 4-hydroxy-2-oxoglutarate aldolase/2-dehydro-3-deoxy-phosphogluconate aldolase [Anthocerotibacter panamensis]
MAHPLVARWQTERLVAVIRAPEIRSARALAGAVRQAGIALVEVTLTFSGALDLLQELAPPVGCGTVLTPTQAKDALAAGAQFLVSPIADPDIIGLGRDHGVLVVSGAWTPTEIHTAWSWGADVIKLFPAHLGGVPYLKSLRQVFSEVLFFPCGGVDFAIVPDYIRAGALAVGMGQGLLKEDQLAQKVQQVRVL